MLKKLPIEVGHQRFGRSPQRQRQRRHTAKTEALSNASIPLMQKLYAEQGAGGAGEPQTGGKTKPMMVCS